jgi:hypothetical protein
MELGALSVSDDFQLSALELAVEARAPPSVFLVIVDYRGQRQRAINRLHGALESWRKASVGMMLWNALNRLVSSLLEALRRLKHAL